MSSDENIPNDAEACYEAIASQEEICLEETEEELRAILTFYDLTPSSREVKDSMSDASNNPCMNESHDEQLNHAAEELITGDSDDPPLSEEAIAEMLETTQVRKRFGGTFQE
jgi:hypothetical protein